MSHRLRRRHVLPFVVAGAISAAALAAPEGAAAANVRCVGNADFCGARSASPVPPPPAS
jgi:hypothetical protein